MRNAQAWYIRERRERAESFRAEVEYMLKRIEEDPHHFPPHGKRFRRALLLRFPYQIFFIINETTIVVMAIVHTSRSPQVWQSRL